MVETNFVDEVIQAGGRLIPLVLPRELSGGTGVMNPSIGLDPDGELLVNLRSVNYVFYNNEHMQRFPSRYGPLLYIHPENDVALRTQNYLGRLDKNYNVTNIAWVDTSALDTPPKWTFSGHEDVRVITWGGKLYLTGVRRDTTEDGQGRMELSEIVIEKKSWKVSEVNRIRIPGPGANNAYCEKNWVPILGKQFQYLKWSCPTEVVEVTLREGQASCHTVSLKEGFVPPRDQRGSTHVIPWGKHYIAMMHEVDLTKNYLDQKNAIYRHRVCVWDQDFKLVGVSQHFSLLSSRVEFACGGLRYKKNLLVSFGMEDNCSFLLEIPESYVDVLVERIVDAAS